MIDNVTMQIVLTITKTENQSITESQLSVVYILYIDLHTAVDLCNSVVDLIGYVKEISIFFTSRRLERPELLIQ